MSFFFSLCIRDIHPFHLLVGLRDRRTCAVAAKPPSIILSARPQHHFTSAVPRPDMSPALGMKVVRNGLHQHCLGGGGHAMCSSGELEVIRRLTEFGPAQVVTYTPSPGASGSRGRRQVQGHGCCGLLVGSQSSVQTMTTRKGTLGGGFSLREPEKHLTPYARYRDLSRRWGGKPGKNSMLARMLRPPCAPDWAELLRFFSAGRATRGAR